jgi:hypothetical protein
MNLSSVPSCALQRKTSPERRRRSLAMRIIAPESWAHGASLGTSRASEERPGIANNQPWNRHPEELILAHCFLLHAASIPRRVASRDFSHFLERERGELRHGWGRAEGDGGWVVFSFSGFQGLFVFSFICHCARTRARVALSRVGLSPASAAAMVRGEKASAIWGALRVGEGLSGLVLIGWRLVPKEPPI